MYKLAYLEVLHIQHMTFTQQATVRVPEVKTFLFFLNYKLHNFQTRLTSLL